MCEKCLNTDRIGGWKIVDGDLISRKALLEEIRSFRCSITGLRAGKGVLARAADEYRKSILRIIEEQPVAFDRRKVIKDLDECRKLMLSPVNEDCFGEPCKENDCTACVLAKAIDIVEKGGTE